MKDFEILVLQGTNPSGVAMTRDILEAARLFAVRTGHALPTWSFHSPTGGAVRLQGGMSIDTLRLPDRKVSQGAVLVIPGIWVENARGIRQRVEQSDAQQVIAYLRRRGKAGAAVAASCSAAFLLNAAGLLHERRATTTWWLSPELSRIAPDAHIDGSRILCIDGPVITAGAAFAQQDVMLYLLRQRFGATLAEGVSHVLLLHERSESAQFVVPSMLATGDALVSKLTKRIESALPDIPSVAELASEFRVSERTLSRHVRHATGMGTNAMIQSVRVHRARALLRTSRMTIEQVAFAVGYRDSTALRRLMQKAVGTTPGQVRATASVAAQRQRAPKKLSTTKG
ncbi:helix-turn-helix domain-containing protein [Lysobacter sp. HA18]